MEHEVLPAIQQPTTLIRRTPSDVVLQPIMDVKLAQERLRELHAFCAEYLKESKDGGNDGGDYGVIPGTGHRQNLLKSGADKLCDVFGLADTYVILSEIEDFDRGLFDYKIECRLVRKTDQMFVGSGVGSCSSYESKYRWRDARRTCPQCNSETIIRGKEEYGGGWICWRTKGGCGAKFSAEDPAIVNQKLGRVENPDIVDQKNTVLKMAKKRAKIDAVIGVTRSSGIFTQDMDDQQSGDDDDKSAPAQSAQPAQPAPTGETHAEKIARVKAEQAAKQKPAPVESKKPEPVKAEPKSEPKPATPVPAPAKPVQEPGDLPDGYVHITGINVKNGPMVVKDGGETGPAWGPLYIVTFTPRLKAPDGQVVSDASTFNEALAGKIETARDKGVPVKLTIEAGKKKGSYVVTGVLP